MIVLAARKRRLGACTLFLSLGALALPCTRLFRPTRAGPLAATLSAFSRVCRAAHDPVVKVLNSYERAVDAASEELAAAACPPSDGHGGCDADGAPAECGAASLSYGYLTCTLRRLWTEEVDAPLRGAVRTLRHKWMEEVHGPSRRAAHAALADLIANFDENGDGSLSMDELVQLKQNLLAHPWPFHLRVGGWTYYQQAWPMLDWKILLFLWRTAGGLALVGLVVTIVPGPLHGYSGRLLRWPALCITYGLVCVDLVLYVSIRLFIRAIEAVFASRRHRRMRRRMRAARSYDDWYEIANSLDASQGRDGWQAEAEGGRYNWAYVRDLMRDMRTAVQSGNYPLAFSTLQQCSRKNVGGIMSDELFSYTNTGEPKLIVSEFIEEVSNTLHWLTEETIRRRGVGIDNHVHHTGTPTLDQFPARKEDYGGTPERKGKVDGEKHDPVKMVLDVAGGLTMNVLRFATIGLIGGDGDEQKESGEQKEAKGPDVAVEVTVSNIDAETAPPLPLPLPFPPPLPLRQVGSPEDDEYPPIADHVIKQFLRRARAAYGRTALILSGGAGMGMYHFGHLKALLETDCLPHIISGTSAGSIIGAMACTMTDDELAAVLTPEIIAPRITCFESSLADRAGLLYREGVIFDKDEWMRIIRWFTCGDMTFEEAYRKTGRVLCITLTATTKKAPPVLLNYITAPNVVIASATLASAALPGFVKPVRLMVKDSNGVLRYQGQMDQTYHDGSIMQDVPIAGLAEMFNCQFFLVAQCNPHIVPFFFNRKGDVGRPSRWSNRSAHDHWRGGFVLSALELYLKLMMKAKMKFVNELEAAVGFTGTLMTQEHEGSATIVPQAHLVDYFKLMSDPSVTDMEHYFQGGAIAAYEKCAMMRLHNEVSLALGECIQLLESGGGVEDAPGPIELPPHQNRKGSI